MTLSRNGMCELHFDIQSKGKFRECQEPFTAPFAMARKYYSFKISCTILMI